MGRTLAAILLLVLVPAIAAADQGVRVKERLEAGRKLYQDLEYRKAVRELAPIRTDPSATRAQRLEALELIGLASFILGDEEGARDSFEEVLAIDPGYQLREASGAPKIRAFFEEVKKAYVPDYKPGQRVSLEHGAPAGATAGRRVELDAIVTAGEDLVKEIILHWRRRGVMAYTEAPLAERVERRWRVRFTPPDDPTDYEIEYWLDARDLARKSLARVAGPETPLTLSVKGAIEPVAPVWYKRWYVWVGVGAAAMVAVGTWGVLTIANDVPSGTLDNVDLGR